jgi:hypothetical protein
MATVRPRGQQRAAAPAALPRCGRTTAPHYLFLLLLLLSAAALRAHQAPTATQAFFNQLDSNRDGQLQASELATHISQTLGDPAGGGGASGAARPPATTAGSGGGSSGSAAGSGDYYATTAEVQRAVQQAVSSVDGSDAGTTISVAELERHLSGAVLPVRAFCSFASLTLSPLHRRRRSSGRGMLVRSSAVALYRVPQQPTLTSPHPARPQTAPLPLLS